MKHNPIVVITFSYFFQSTTRVGESGHVLAKVGGKPRSKGLENDFAKRVEGHFQDIGLVSSDVIGRERGS